MSTPTLRLIALAVMATLVFSAGWLAEGWRMEAQIAELQHYQKAAESRAAQAALFRLQEAQKKGEALATRLAASENARQTETEEKNNALRRLTAGRPCLSGAAVRVLNQPPGTQPAALPETAGQPVSTDAGFATDTDVGIWANTCRSGYDTCRGRLGAIADFYEDKAP